MTKRDKTPEDHHKPATHRSVEGEITVRGAVQVFDSEGANQQHKSEREEDKSYKEATKIFEDRYILIYSIVVVFTALLVAFTLYIAWQGKRSADAATRQSETAINGLKIGERPYLWVPAIGITGQFPSTEKVEFDMQVANFGRTPAMNVHPSFYISSFAILGTKFTET
jgi:hypothetical protein